MGKCSVCGKGYGHYCSNCSYDENFSRGYCSDECRKSQGLESYTDDELIDFITAYRADVEPLLREAIEYFWQDEREQQEFDNENDEAMIEASGLKYEALCRLRAAVSASRVCKEIKEGK